MSAVEYIQPSMSAWDMKPFADVAEFDAHVVENMGTYMYKIVDKKTKRPLTIRFPEATLGMKVAPREKKGTKDVADNKSFSYFHLSPTDCAKKNCTVQEIHAAVAMFEKQAIAHLRDDATLCPAKWKGKPVPVIDTSALKESDQKYPDSLGFCFYVASNDQNLLSSALVQVNTYIGNRLFKKVPFFNKGAVVKAVVSPRYIWVNGNKVGCTWIVTDVLVLSNTPVVICVNFEDDNTAENAEKVVEEIAPYDYDQIDYHSSSSPSSSNGLQPTSSSLTNQTHRHFDEQQVLMEFPASAFEDGQNYHDTEVFDEASHDEPLKKRARNF